MIRHRGASVILCLLGAKRRYEDKLTRAFDNSIEFIVRKKVRSAREWNLGVAQRATLAAVAVVSLRNLLLVSLRITTSHAPCPCIYRLTACLRV